MAVPDYQTLMTPTLDALADGEPKSTIAVREIVAARLPISAEDRQQTIKSGAPVFDSRVQWALTYLSQAGLVRRPKRGIVQITDRGRDVLREHPDRIDNHVLIQFEEFRDFKSRARDAQTRRATPSPDAPPPALETATEADTGSPRETITAAVEETNAAVAAELLVRIREQDPAFLERLVLLVLTAMGYGGAKGSAEQLGRSGDEGLDGVIHRTPLASTASMSRPSGTQPTGRLAVQTSRASSGHSTGRRLIAACSSPLAGSVRTRRTTPTRCRRGSS